MVTGRSDYTGSVIVTGSVSITAGHIIIDSGSITVSGSVTVSSGSITITSGHIIVDSGSISVSGSVSITSGHIIVDSGSITVSGSITITSGHIIVDSGSITVSGTVSISGTVTVTGAVTVTGSVTVSGTVAISGTVTVTGSVTVSGTVAISGTVTVSGTVAISGTVTVSGAVTISSGTVSITGSVTITGAVTITSGSVNIATAGGTNVIIDKLTQTAYTTRDAFNMRNDNGISSGDPPSSMTDQTYWIGKYFPHGCRGHIRYCWIYCKRTGSGTLSLYYSPSPRLGALYGPDVVTPGANWGWVGSAGLDQYWPYDSLYIFIKGIPSDVSVGHDGIQPYDATVSTDSGVTVSSWDYRFYFMVRYNLASVGDIPIAGTLNTIAIPNSVGSISHTTNGSVNGGVTADMLATIYGAGELLGLNVMTRQNAGSTVVDSNQIVGIVIDGIVFEVAASDVVSLSSSTLSGSAAPFILIHITAATNVYSWALTKNLPFQRSLRIYVRNGAANGQTMWAEVLFAYTLLK